MLNKNSINIKTKRNFYVLNPHTIAISKTIACHIYNLPYDKLSYLKNLLIRKEVKVCLHASSSLPFHKLNLPLFLNRIITIIEYIIWLTINKYKWIGFCTIYNIPKGSVVLIDKFNTITKESINCYEILDKRNCKLIFYFTHFFFDISTKSKLLKRFKNSKYMAESILIQPKFSKIDESKFLFFPYSAEKRFYEANKNRKKRISKILVVGSVVLKQVKNKEELKKEYGDILINPNRIKFYRNHINYPDKIEYLASVYDPIKDIRDGKKNKYLSLDIAKYYSSYQFFVCPEDITGMPSRCMVEGLASGCIYFGNNNLNYFKDYNMIPYKHFIPYDGTIEDLLIKWELIKDDYKLIKDMSNSIREMIKYYSVHNLSLEFSKIAKNLTNS